MTRGKILLAKFPFTDLTSFKRRPALVLSPKPNENGDIILAFISSKIPSSSRPTDLIVLPSTKNGLKLKSVVKFDKIATVNEKIITGEIGTISPDIMQEADIKLRIAVGLM